MTRLYPWNPFFERSWVRISLIAFAEIFVVYGLWDGVERKPELIPLLIASLPCVIAGVLLLKPLYQRHFRVWVRLTKTDLPLSLLSILLLLIVWGWMGGGIGLFHLFWHDHWWISFGSGFGVGLFWSVMGYLAFLLYCEDLYIRAGAHPINEANGVLWQWLRRIPANIGNIIRWLRGGPLAQLPPKNPMAEGRARRKVIQDLVNRTDLGGERDSQIFWLIGPLVVMTLFPVFYSTSTRHDIAGRDAYGDGFDRLRQTVLDRSPFAWGVFLAVGLLFAFLKYFPTGVPVVSRLPALPNKLKNPIVIFFRHWTFWLFTAGIFLCLALRVIMLFSSKEDASRLQIGNGIGLLMLISILSLLLFRWFGDPSTAGRAVGSAEWRLRLAARILFFFAACGIVVLHILNQLRVMTAEEAFLFPPAGLTIAILLASIAVGYGWLRIYRRGSAVVTLIILCVVYGLFGGLQTYPHRLEGLEEYYDLESTSNRGSSDPKSKPSLFHYRELQEKNDWGQLDNEDVLTGWAKTIGKNTKRAEVDATLRLFSEMAATALNSARVPLRAPNPPLIIVTTSGGASNSAIFTLNVLIELERRHPGISRHVRIICGASGGMFGAAYYRSRLREILEANPRRQEEIFADMRERMSKDFLSGVAKQWIFKDLAMGFCPFAYVNDRGLELEREWTRDLDMKLTFNDMRDEERSGEYPSMIFSPTLVEDGRQLLISTLDLKSMVETEAREYDADDAVQRIRAVEFFKLFPKANEFQLRTAVRLNATFPFVSPSATLPTTPPRRVVDAGYYDNHGMNVAATWVYANKEWITKNTSEVIVIQCRVWYWAFAEDVDAEKPPTRFDRPLTDMERSLIAREKSVDWRKVAHFSPWNEYTTPVIGGYNALRSSMVFRNAQQFQLLERIIPPAITMEGSFKGVRSYTFLGNLDSSMNWYLPKHEAKRIEMVVRAASDPPSLEQETVSWFRDNKDFKGALHWNAKQFDEMKNSNASRAYFPFRP